MDVKDLVVGIAGSLGFQRAVVGSLAPMEEERRQFEDWLSRGYAAGMEYLRRNPHFRTSPQLLYPGARSAIVVSTSYYTEPPADPGPRFGRVARYAVGLDYHAVLRARLRELKAQVEEKLGRPLIGKAYTDDVALFEQAYARRSGLGFSGKNTMIIGPRLMGSYHFVAELFTDLELEPDVAYEGTCGKCFRCGDICPTAALVEPGSLDARLCISYLTIENREGIPVELRARIGDWLFGCDLCQEVCPYNQRPPVTSWPEFMPAAGAGHYVDLLGLLAIKSEEEFRQRFRHTPLRRPKRRGLIRNALVVLGNRRPGGMVGELAAFAGGEEDPMLREHAAWALAQYDDPAARAQLKKLISREPDQAARRLMESYRDGGAPVAGATGLVVEDPAGEP